jgi:hypothetical protein
MWSARPERTRRGALRAALAGGALAAVGVASGASAKKRNRKRCRCTPRALGELCSTNKQCCANQTNRICALKNGEGAVATRCCGGLGASCDETTDCCNNFDCEDGSCVVSP